MIARPIHPSPAETSGPPLCRSPLSPRGLLLFLGRRGPGSQVQSGPGEDPTAAPQSSLARRSYRSGQLFIRADANRRETSEAPGTSVRGASSAARASGPDRQGQRPDPHGSPAWSRPVVWASLSTARRWFRWRRSDRPQRAAGSSPGGARRALGFCGIRSRIAERRAVSSAGLAVRRDPVAAEARRRESPRRRRCVASVIACRLMGWTRGGDPTVRGLRGRRGAVRWRRACNYGRRSVDPCPWLWHGSRTPPPRYHTGRRADIGFVWRGGGNAPGLHGGRRGVTWRRCARPV